MFFEKLYTDSLSSARAGVLHTDHGDIPTPIFMPVGTVGSVKGVFHRDLAEDTDAKIILGNTYHLLLRPGTELINRAGGLHKFVGWERPILTDSGGFQVFSLAENRKITEEGCTFRSHIDGSKHIFTPENNVDIQRLIGADIIMALDECTPGTADFEYSKKSMERTHRWLQRCIKRFKETEPHYGYRQFFFPIVQGCVYPELRREAARVIAEADMDGCAIGGLSVGEPTDVMYQMLDVLKDEMPTEKPRYLMGVGTPANLLEGIERGVDMFDCVMPTRNGRNGMLFTWEGTINIKNKCWEDDFSPIDENGKSFVDNAYTKAYLRHMFVAGEMLGAEIASYHNLAFYLDVVTQAREHIIAGDFKSWKTQAVEKLSRRLTI
ncbi:MAG: tRNA guanosine(34) transglycosylase Tgt [Bacteroidales bacterium]|nr:tRNA guanosine(34) transglycosylase Tgt [Bacteroidales bacterium]